MVQLNNWNKQDGKAELHTGRVHPWVGLDRVGSDRVTKFSVLGRSSWDQSSAKKSNKMCYLHARNRLFVDYNS